MSSKPDPRRWSALEARIGRLSPSKRRLLDMRMRLTDWQAPADRSQVEFRRLAAGTRLPFFCVHAIFGEVASYVELAKVIGANQPFLAIEAQGLEGTAPPRASIPEMVRAYHDGIVRAQPVGPYHLGGWSLGGMIAGDVARLLVQEGREVGLLALIDSPAPISENFAHVGESVSEGLRRYSESPFGKGLDARSVELEEARHLGLPDTISFLEVLERRVPASEVRTINLLRVCRANLVALSNWEPARIPTPAVLYRAGGAGGEGARGWERCL